MTKSATRIQDKDTSKRLSVVQSTEDPTKYGVVILNPDGSKIRGPKGDAATVTVGTTTTGNPGTNASVTNSGTTSDAVLNFTIPRGDKGEIGTAATIAVGTTTTGDAGTSASVTNSGTSSAAVFDFVIPKGDKGNTGDAATIAVGTTTTGAPGSSASVVNSGTSGAAVFDFTIPQGIQGEQGETGNGIASVTSSKSGKTTTVTITETNGDTDTFQIEDGADGQGAGDVLGPNSSTDGDIVLFDGTTGKLIKDSGTALSAKANDSDVVHKAGTETVTGQKTFAAVTKIQSGNPAGALIIGANLNEASVTANTRKMARMGMPSYDNDAPVTIISGDSQNNKVNLVDFGGNPLASSSSAPDFIRFVVAKTHGDTSSSGKINMFEVSNYAGNDVNNLPHVKGIALNATSRLSDDAIPAVGDNSNEVPSTSWVNTAIGNNIVDNLTSTSTTSSLSANQGKNLKDAVDTINGKIPSAATSSNQLADKDYVNDGINSVTAYYITKNANGDQFATYAELSAATTFYSGGTQRTPTRNDYTIVLADENYDNATTRYIYNSSWEYQYTVNETALTQTQLNAINSGITAAKVTTYDGYATGKQDTLTTQTAYTTKGTSTKVPTISTNTLGQVTAITETSIDFPVTSVNGSTGAVTVTDTTYTAGTGLALNGTEFSNSGVTSFNGSTGAVTYTAPVTSVGGSTGAVTLKTINSNSLVGTGNITALTAETVVSGVSGTTYTIKVSSSAPGSGTPNTTITFVK